MSGYANGRDSVTHTITATWTAGGGGSGIVIYVDGQEVAKNYKVDLPTNLYSNNSVSYKLSG